MLPDPSKPLSVGDTAQALDLLLGGTIPVEAGATFLSTWAARGETGQEVAAVVTAMLERAEQIPLSGPAFDLCGTGGSGLTRYNVSTTVAFILAALGVPVAKHGNRGSKRPNGSFDLLEALGIPFQLSPRHHAELFADTGVCFLFARQMHPAVGAVAPMRKLAGGRTIFNVAGPLANPCRPVRQVVGVANERTAQVIITALKTLGTQRAVVVRGHPGLDEISVTGPTHAWDLRNDHAHHLIFEHFHHAGLSHDDLPGGDADENARLFGDIVAGRAPGPLEDMVVINAAVALACWRELPGLEITDVANEVREALRDGRVERTVLRHRRMARRLAGLDA